MGEKGEKFLLSDQLVNDNLRTLFFAGHDTTAAALTWALHLLAKHPDWQQRLRAEAQAAGFKAASEVSNAKDVLPEGFSLMKIEELTSLTAFVRETLRIYPSAAFGKEAIEPVKVKASTGKEYVLPPGVELIFMPALTHVNPDLEDDPWAFNPVRWSDPNAVSSTGDKMHLLDPTPTNASPTYASPTSTTSPKRASIGSAVPKGYYPFSLGPRNCLGERLAKTELRVALAMLVTNFSFEVPPDAAEPLRVALLTLQPMDVKLNIRAL